MPLCTGWGKLATVFARYLTRVRRTLRLLPLPFSIALCLPALAAEKPPNWGLCPTPDVLPKFDDAQQPDAKLAQNREQQPTNIEGDQLSGTTTIPNYTGNVALKRGDQFMGTDSLRVDTETGNYIAEGHVRYQDSSIRMIADRAEGNQDTDTHKITNIRYQLLARRGNGKADSVDLQGALGQMHRSTYTTCDPSQRVWELHAPEIDVDNDEGFGTARNAILKIYNFPVLYAPWFKFPIDDRRSSGFLFPAIGMSSRNGFDYTQPYYLNLAPNYDATLYPRFMARRGLMLGSEFRYLYDGGKGELQAAYLPDDKLRDKDRGRFSYQGYHNINSQWQARASLAWVSDERYTEDFSNRLLGNAVSNIQSTIGVYGTGETWTAGVMADRWQLTDYTLTEDALPYNRQPRAFFNWDQSFGNYFEAGLYSEAVRFVHDDIHQKTTDGTYERTGVVTPRPGGTRLDLKPYISMPLAGAAWFLKPTLAWRYTAYQLDKDLAATLGGDTTPSRSLPIATVDAGVYFDRDTKWGNTNYLQTLEPRLFYLYTPYRDQNDLPIFDTREFTFSWGQLFRDSRYTGADRQNDANQLTMALSSRLLRQDDGKEKLSVSLGQILYFSDSRVSLPNSDTTIEQGKSAWVADANYMINDRWNLGATYQWDPKYRRKDLASFRARYLMPGDGIVNIAYRYRRDLLEQADVSFLYPINPTWSVVGRHYYSLMDKKPLESILGVQWDSCCLAVRALARRYVRNRTGALDTAFQIEFVLKGLSSLGQDTDRVLRRAILGYNRDDLYLVPPSNTTTDPDAYDPNQIP
ncbi:LPS-assembly protein LptD [Xanthomonas sacchari]|nr:LPS-assembly protein LptD [Xanthomonas sacchari]MCW0446645.1 LPS-assembly protein LptD [Xanthomonas sacchari]